MRKKCGAFLSGEDFEAGADDSPEVLDGASGSLAQDRLEFCEQQLDWIEIGTVGRKVDESCAAGFDCLANARDLMDADIVHDDNITPFEGRSEYLLDIGFEAQASHRPVQQEGSGDTIVA